MIRGYFRFPAVFKNKVVFTSEDDLWEVPLEGGAARRLTAERGRFSYPRFSPDGRQLAFASAEEGYNEVYVMHSEGGDLHRLTYLGALSNHAAGLMPRASFFVLRLTRPTAASWVCAR